MNAPAMKAVRVHAFGGVDNIVLDDIPIPVPAENQVLIKVKAAGVGNWDALARSGKIPQPLPLTLGADVSGIVEKVGPGVSAFAPGDEVFGLTNDLFTGGYAEHAVVQAGAIAKKPQRSTFIEAASVPVVAVTAHKMLFEHGNVKPDQTVLVHGAAGNVGAYIVQLAHRAGARVIATAGKEDMAYVRGLGADQIIDYRNERFEDIASGVDAVMDTVGGDIQERSLKVLKRGGVLVSSVSPPDKEKAAEYGVTTDYFIVPITTGDLASIATLLDAKELTTRVGIVLPLSEARKAHEMLDGIIPHPRGKIVLQP
jgi:NADPH:quinone reductase-like Zn-dependent oxidoreductase